MNVTDLLESAVDVTARVTDTIQLDHTPATATMDMFSTAGKMSVSVSFENCLINVLLFLIISDIRLYVLIPALPVMQ